MKQGTGQIGRQKWGRMFGAALLILLPVSMFASGEFQNDESQNGYDKFKMQ